jgi:ATP-dependent DNA helicase RecQ
MIKAIILDLDDTLIDTNALEPLRAARKWTEIRSELSRCSVHEDVLGLLNTAHSAGMKIAIFTNAPSNYVQSLLKHFEISVDFVVAYHDVKNHKPDQEGVDRILAHFDVSNNEAIYLGDSDLDKDAAANAGVEFFTVDWGSASNVDQGHVGVSKLSELIGTKLGARSDGEIRSELQRNGNRLYLGYYLEGIKQEVLAFKNGSDTAIERWSNKAVELSDYFPIVDVVVRALGHSELKVSGTDQPLDKLALSLANSLGASYKPELLEKNRALVKSTKMSAEERREQVRGAYSVSSDKISASESEKLTFLIVDDVYTSGATAHEISRAISEAYSEANIYVFTLVKTLYRSEAGKASAEMQLNTLLFTDIYDPAELDGDVESDQAISVSRKYKGKLVTKKFSANYARTNHNFVFHNLQPYSIASEPNSSSIFSAVQILKNMLQRGKPTIASRRLRSAFGLSLPEGGISTSALALISNKPSEWRRLIRGEEKSGHYPAKRFFDELIPKYLGDYGFVKQLIVPEVQIFDMTQVYVDQFNNRQVDFFIPQVGLIIEIDGPQHQRSEEVDAKRDAFTESLGLKTIRFTTQEVASENSKFLQKMAWVCTHVERIDNLERKGTLNPPNGITLRDYQTVFAEGVERSDSRVRLTAAIRFQLLLLELLERGELRLGKPKKLLLINRDRIDFAKDALEDLNEFMVNLLQLQGASAGSFDLEIEELEEVPNNRPGSDLIIDFSILERYDDTFQVNQDVIYSRTHYFDFYRHFPYRDAGSIESSALTDYDFFQMSCTDPIAYNLDLSPDSSQREALRYFLSNLFLPFLDEVDFREGQVGIVGSALSRHGTIGLLPTGSGKSICYQLSAVLQPAISFVVCPIKSLMYDQKADLDGIGFTRSNYITGDLNADEKAQIQRDFGCGRYFFVLISPERFQTHGFRKEMSAIGLDLAFAYAVIDEVHCLSEWGHDFRTSYLNLANTITKFAPSSSYIGLTATASVNVLKDIQTEFGIPDEYVRTPLDFTREELAFHVIDDKGRKGVAVVNLVAEMESKWNGGEGGASKAGIIFTPNVNGSKGCHILAGRLSSALSMDVRFFSGSAPKTGSFRGETFNAYKRQVQEDFKSNKYRLLTATKAFGMGVNKGNIAYTVHFGIPGSMEALYQEAGRAGRDKKLFKKTPADCYVLLTNESNTELLDKIWDSSTNVADLKAHAKKLSRDSDVNTNLFLMTNGLDTINDEFKLISAIYSDLQNNDDQQTITLTAGKFGSEKSKFEKAIYRLSQLGIVLDWVIEDFFKGTLLIEFQCLSEKQLEKNIERTVRKYEPSFKLDDVFASDSHYYRIICEKLHEGVINKTRFIFLVLLLWSYDHFVYNRRQSLKTVYEHCSDLAAGVIGENEFKDRLEGFFKFNESSRLLLHLAENSADTNLWLSVFFQESGENSTPQIISNAALLTLREQLSRFLESYKNNDCLNYLSGIVRLTVDQFDDVDGERRMSLALEHLLSEDKESALRLVRQTLRLKELFSEDAQCRFARLVHEKFDDISILKEVNKGFGDPYSYHRLLVPLASRLERITSSYKGIEW